MSLTVPSSTVASPRKLCFNIQLYKQILPHPQEILSVEELKA